MKRRTLLSRLQKIFLLLVAIILSNDIHAQIITTIAGSAGAGFSGDGGPATAARFTTPVGIDIDMAGSLFIADIYNVRIRKIDPLGIITTIAGNGVYGFATVGMPATASALKNPMFVAADMTGNVYVSEYYYPWVLKINSSGYLAYAAGSSTYGYSGDGGAATAALLDSVAGINTDAMGNLYICDYGNNRVRKIYASGIITTIAGNGIFGYSGDGGAATAASICPRSVITDAPGNVYVSDEAHHVVRKIDVAGIITTIAGTGTLGYTGDGGAATAANLSFPKDIEIDTAGNLFICNGMGERIRMVNTAGIITTIAGTSIAGYAGDGGPATACRLNGSRDIAIKPGCEQRIYLADLANNRIREIVYHNSLPIFVHGHALSINVCPGTTMSIDSLLAAVDSNTAQPVNWTVAIAPLYGTVAASYTTASTGSTVTPLGLTYTASGSTGADTFRIMVNDCGYLPDTITFYVTIPDCTLGSQLLQRDEVRIYPSPAQNELTIKAAAYSLFTITNTLGQQLKQQHIATPETKVDVSMLPADMYYIMLSGGQGHLVRKFVKQ